MGLLTKTILSWKISEFYETFGFSSPQFNKYEKVSPIVGGK
jgi:hypothetical protein